MNDKKLNEQFHQPEPDSRHNRPEGAWALGNGVAEALLQQSHNSPPMSPNNAPKTDYRKTFHMPKSSPFFAAGSNSSSGAQPLTTEDDINQQRKPHVAGRPGEPSPSSSPKATQRKNLFDGNRGIAREPVPYPNNSNQGVASNALLASYFQTNYIAAGGGLGNVGNSQNRFTMNPQRASRLETAGSRDSDSNDSHVSNSKLNPVNMRFKNTNQPEAGYLFSRQTTALSMDPSVTSKQSTNAQQQTMPKGNQDVLPVNKARVQRDNAKRLTKAPPEHNFPKIQRMRKIGVVLPCGNYLDRDEENEIKFGIKSVCDAQSPVTLMITGNSGSGKTSIVATLLNEERHEVFLWYECHAEVIIWLNVHKESKSFDEDAFFDEIGDVLEVEFGSIKPRTRLKIKSLLERDPTKRFLFVLDDISNKKILELLLSLGSTIRCITITRDAREAGLHGHRSNIRTVPVKELNDRQILHILENPLKDKLGFNKLKPLAPMSLGLPLLAAMIRACFLANEQEESHKTYGFLFEALSRRPEEGMPTAEPIRTLTKLLLFILNKETNEMRWYFYSFLLFDYSQPIDAADAAVLWDLKETEAATVCAQFHAKTLLQVVDAVESEKRLHLGYCVHHLVHKAAAEAARVGRFIEQDPSEIKAKFVNSEVLYRAATRRRKLILKPILLETDSQTLEKLCKHKYGPHGQSFFHLLYCVKWRVTSFGTEHNVSAELLANLINKLNKARVDTAKILAQEDLIGDSALMRIIENRDDHTAEHRLLKTVVESVGQKIICKMAAIRYWTAKLSHVNDNSTMFMAALRGNYSDVEELIRTDPTLVSKKNGQGETPIMAGAGTGSLAIVRLLHRAGGASLDDADFNGMNPLLIACATGRADIVHYLQENSAKMGVTNDEGRTALMLASFAGYLDIVKNLLKVIGGTSDVNIPDHEGVTALMLAAWNGHVEVTEELLEHGADPFSMDRTGNSALLCAAQGGSSDVASRLLKAGAKADSCDHKGTTALMKAAARGNVDIIQLLHGKAAKINQTDHQGASALFYAVEYSQFKTVQILYGYGAMMTTTKKNGFTLLMQGCLSGNFTSGIQFLLANGCKIDAADRDGLTALMIAAREGKADIADLLISSGALVTMAAHDGTTAMFLAADHGHSEIVKLLHANKGVLTTHREDGVTPLMAASAKGYRDVVEYLIANGCPPNISDKSGQTALMKAAANCHLDTVNLLLLSGASVNAADHTGLTPLICASASGHIDVVKALLAKNAKISAYDRTGQSALMAAVHGGHVAVAELLQTNGADVNQKQRDGTTPLMAASHLGHAEIVQFLHAKRADLNAADDSGMTALMEAAHQGHKEVVKFLLRVGANVNAVDRDGATALFWAVESGHLEITKLLHERGALINIRKKNGVTPLMQAAFSRNDPLVIFLQQNGAK